MKIDIIGDIHGCYEEFYNLTIKLGYDWSSGYPIHDQRKLGFVGEFLTDRGPHSLKLLKLYGSCGTNSLPIMYREIIVIKLYRYFLGRKVQITHGLETTVAELKACTNKEENHHKKMFMQLYEESPLYQVF